MNLLFDLKPEEFAKLKPGSRESLVERRYIGLLRQGDAVLWSCPDLHLRPGTATDCASTEIRRRLRMFRRIQQRAAYKAASR
jgi:hypothetical protein